MKISGGDTNIGWTDRLIDPFVAEAERVLSNRQARNQFLGPDLFGEPAWEILLSAFVASRRSRVCVVESLARELNLSSNDMRHWIERLVERGLIEDHGLTVVITRRADDKIRRLFTAHLREMAQEFGPGDGILQFSSSSVAEGE